MTRRFQRDLSARLAAEPEESRVRLMEVAAIESSMPCPEAIAFIELGRQILSGCSAQPGAVDTLDDPLRMNPIPFSRAREMQGGDSEVASDVVELYALCCAQATRLIDAARASAMSSTVASASVSVSLSAGMCGGRAAFVDRWFRDEGDRYGGCLWRDHSVVGTREGPEGVAALALRVVASLVGDVAAGALAKSHPVLVAVRSAVLPGLMRRTLLEDHDEALSAAMPWLPGEGMDELSLARFPADEMLWTALTGVGRPNVRWMFGFVFPGRGSRACQKLRGGLTAAVARTLFFFRINQAAGAHVRVGAAPCHGREVVRGGVTVLHGRCNWDSGPWCVPLELADALSTFTACPALTQGPYDLPVTPAYEAWAAGVIQRAYRSLVTVLLAPGGRFMLAAESRFNHAAVGEKRARSEEGA